MRLIPPSAADTVHYRVQIPADAKADHVRRETELSQVRLAQVCIAGEAKPGQDPSLITKDTTAPSAVDVSNIPKNVSGEIKNAIPQLPITVLARATASIPLSDGRTPTVWTQVAGKIDRERWNDWGIGLLLQGDLKGAEYAFRKVTEAEPGYADGWINVARALIQEGENDAAKPFIEQALKIAPTLDRIYYFKALTQKTDGDYPGALQSLQRTAAQYPRPRRAEPDRADPVPAA